MKYLLIITTCLYTATASSAQEAKSELAAAAPFIVLTIPAGASYVAGESAGKIAVDCCLKATASETAKACVGTTVCCCTGSFCCFCSLLVLFKAAEGGFRTAIHAAFRRRHR